MARPALPGRHTPARPLPRGRGTPHQGQVRWGPPTRWVESVLWRGRGRADFVALLDPADRKWCREYTGTWREKYERNFPGPFYSTTMNLNSLAACAAAADDRLVGRGRPRLVICAHDSTEWIWRQPADVDEMRRLLVAMANDEVDSYACDGNRHWALGSIRDWWRERDRILEWARRSLSETRHDPADCELGAPEASDHDALRALIAYSTGPAERDLRRYAFFLAERRAPKTERRFPGSDAQSRAP